MISKAQVVNLPLKQPSSSARGEEPVSLPMLFKALGDGLRVQILRLLRGDSFSVTELCDVFQLRQSALSHHLKILVQAELLTRRKEGTAAFYRRQLPRGEFEALHQQALDAIDAEPLPKELVQGMARVQAQREQNSLAFFRDNAQRFAEQKELIASWVDYTQAALHMIDRCGDLTSARVLEIGPGDGEFLLELAQRCSDVTGLDNAPAMLESAGQTCAELSQVRLLLGEADTLIEQGERFDLAVANMVLHHTPDPESTLADSAALLQDGGFLIISELCAHDQAWAREHCGDLWLGFEPAQLNDWARAANLESRAELFLAQRNGFQIQVQLFQRCAQNTQR